MKYLCLKKDIDTSFLFVTNWAMRGDNAVQEIVILVLEIILLIIKLGASPEEATRATAIKHGIEFSKLWKAVPKRWK